MVAPQPPAVTGPPIRCHMGLGPVPPTGEGGCRAVLDVNDGHIGDTMMDLAAWRIRDTVIGFGDLPPVHHGFDELILCKGRPASPATPPLRFHAPPTSSRSVPRYAIQPACGSDDQPAVVVGDEPVRHRGARRDPADRATGCRHAPTRCGHGAMARSAHLDTNLRGRGQDRRVPDLQAADHVPGWPATWPGRRRSATRSPAGDLDDLQDLLGSSTRPSWLEGEADLEHFVLAHADTCRMRQRR